MCTCNLSVPGVQDFFSTLWGTPNIATKMSGQKFKRGILADKADVDFLSKGGLRCAAMKQLHDDVWDLIIRMRDQDTAMKTGGKSLVRKRLEEMYDVAFRPQILGLLKSLYDVPHI